MYMKDIFGLNAIGYDKKYKVMLLTSKELSNAFVSIYKEGDTVPIWTGITDETGMVVSYTGDTPELRYGNYNIKIEHCDYDTLVETLNVPSETVKSLTVGCSSAISRHEATYDHTLIGVGGVVPSGTILPFAGQIIPIGYLLCDGSAVSRTTYSNLFSVIGTYYGAGDGSTTFNLPDLRGRAPFGVGASGIVNIGEKGGEQMHTLTVAEMPSHNHSLRNTGTTASPSSGYAAGRGSGWTGYTGGNKPHNNMPPYQGVNYIIKT